MDSTKIGISITEKEVPAAIKMYAEMISDCVKLGDKDRAREWLSSANWQPSTGFL